MASIGIVLFLVILMLLSSVTIVAIANVLFAITLLGGAMTVGAYFNTVPRIKNDFKSKILKRPKLLSRKKEINQEELSKYYIYDNKKIERKILKFAKLFVSIWGISSSIGATAVQIGVFIGLDKFPQISFKPLVHIPPQYTTQIPAPTTPDPFILFTYLFCVPMTMGFLAPAMLLRSTNLRYRKENGIQNPFPKYDFALLAGIPGIIAPAFLFFNNVWASFEMQIALLNFLLLDLIAVGIPIIIFCLFFVWYLEPKLQPKVLSYLKNDLKIKEEM